MWTSLATWVTPTSLFILINVVIATIVITSRRHLHDGPALLRHPSFLDRVKSFNLYPYHSDHHPNPDPPTRLDRAPSVLDRLKSITLYRSDSNDEPETPQSAAEQSLEKTHHDHSISRRKSNTEPHAPTTSFRAKLQKSLSEKLSWTSFTRVDTAAQDETEESVSEIERRRPATTMAEIGEPKALETADEEEEVDVRADDFINKFKQQLKLQRLESLLRYRDMIKGKKH